MTLSVRTLALLIAFTPAAAFAQDSGQDALSSAGIDCNAPGSFCVGKKTTTTTGPDGQSTTTTEQWSTSNGRPLNPNGPKPARTIQPPRDDTPMPGMRFDPALGYYVPNAPATPAAPAPADGGEPKPEEYAPNSFGFSTPGLNPQD